MCPACLVSISMLIAGVVSTGGATAIAAKVFARRKERGEVNGVVDPGASECQTAGEKEKEK